NPAMELTKELNPAGQTFSAAGDVITYGITLQNTGNVPIAEVSVTDPGADNPPALQSGDGGTPGLLEVGETWIYSASYTVGQADINAGSYTNTATAAGQAGSEPLTAEAGVTVNADLNPAMELTKELNPAGQTFKIGRASCR